MERFVAAADTTSSLTEYVSWEEVFVSTDRGRREVHYFLKKRDGISDLAVIGKEKSLRHMSYHNAIGDRVLIPLASPSSSSSLLLKLKSRREVVDWLNSVVSDSARPQSQESTHHSGLFVDGEEVSEWDIEALKDTHLKKLGHYTKEFLWLGSPWTCRKRRKHYQSFRRNGIKISVHDFVHVLAEEDKRLVAYLEDMYEDSRGNKMVVVRWFHKIDEVGIVLPHGFNDREIFFSLCLQDLSIECIDGLASVLSPKHFEKYLNEATHMGLEPFVCHNQFENDDVKPFDITQVAGYWKQEILRYMYVLSPSNVYGISQHFHGMKAVEDVNDAVGMRPKKRFCWSKNDDVHLPCTNMLEPVNATTVDVQNFGNIVLGCKVGTEIYSMKGAGSAGVSSGKDARQDPLLYLTVGSQVEVLSQDSGIRGCWFRASIIKKRKDKVKVQYQDIRDAADEAKMLEEWILAFKTAAPDHLGLRISGRPTVRPPAQSNKGTVSWAVDVGAVVDVWRHDGWWEGIVFRKESEDKFNVYFPGERQKLIFGCGDLRHSQEWLGSGWRHVKDRPELVNEILSSIETKPVAERPSDGKSAEVALNGSRQSSQGATGPVDCLLASGNDKEKQLEVVPDLSKDDLLAQLRWKASRKRRRGGGGILKLHGTDSDSKSNANFRSRAACERFLIPTSLKVDHENCKYIRDSRFGTAVVSPLTSLVMSR